MKKYLIFIIPAFLFSGCSVWENFTTYFNLYYNTVDAFEQAEQQLNDQRKDPFAKFDAPIPGSVTPLLDKVIEKCSRILQFNAGSNYVDDALLMIGKAFYYEKNYIKALRKFQELIATKSESELVLEARLWEAKTNFAMNNSQKGIEQMEKVKQEALETGKYNILKLAYLEEMRYYLIVEDFDVVLPMLTAFIQFNSDDELNARVMYQAGEILAQKQDYTLAAKYYQAAYKEFTPTYETLFLSKLKEGKMLLYLGKPTEALDQFYALRESPKFKDYQDQVELAIGITYVKTEKFDDALALFKRFDTTYTSSQSLGNARYVLAQMYEKDLKNFDSASFYYQKALTSSATAEYLPLIREKSNVFNKYNTALRDYFNNRKQYLYILYPERFVADSLRYALDTVAVASTVQTTEQAKMVENSGYKERERDFDTDLNIEAALAELPARQTADPGTAPIRPTLSLDSSKTIMSRCAVELGNIFLTSLALPDSAFFYYTEVTNVYGSKQYMAKALYGLAGYYASMNDSVTADTLYRNIYENYKEDRLVNEAAKKIGKPQIDLEYDPAKELYTEAQEAFSKGNDSLALKKFEEIVQKHTSSKHVPQAIYASGFILEHSYKKYDSAAVVYDTLVKKYPTTLYAQKVLPKLTFYKDEKARLKQIIDDSLRRIQDSLRADSIAKAPKDTLRPKTDSLAVDSSKVKEPVTVPAQVDSSHNNGTQTPAPLPREPQREEPVKAVPEKMQNQEEPPLPSKELPPNPGQEGTPPPPKPEAPGTQGSPEPQNPDPNKGAECFSFGSYRYYLAVA